MARPLRRFLIWIVVGFAATGSILALQLYHEVKRERVLQKAYNCGLATGRQPAKVEARTNAMGEAMAAHSTADQIGALRMAAAIECISSLFLSEPARQALADATPAIVASDYGGDWTAAARDFADETESINPLSVPLPPPAWQRVWERWSNKCQIDASGFLNCVPSRGDN